MPPPLCPCRLYILPLYVNELQAYLHAYSANHLAPTICSSGFAFDLSGHVACLHGPRRNVSSGFKGKFLNFSWHGSTPFAPCFDSCVQVGKTPSRRFYSPPYIPSSRLRRSSLASCITSASCIHGCPVRGSVLQVRLDLT